MSEPGTLDSRLRSLMVATLAGDGAAYRMLLSETSRLLRAYYLKRLGGAHSAHAEDLVQETLLAIHSRRMTYDPDRAFTAWAYAIARYKLADYFRQSHIRADVPFDDEMDLVDFTSEDSVSARTDIEKVLKTIPDRPGTLIRQVKIEGRSIAEAAAATGVSQSAAKVSIHRGLKALTARFGGVRAHDR